MIIKSKWYGIIHNPVGWEDYTPWSNKKTIFESKYFIESLKYCKVLFVMAKTQVIKIQKKIIELGYNNIKIINLYHPIRRMNNEFSYIKYKNNKNKVICSIGNWLRKHYNIFKLKTNKKFLKAIIPYNKRTNLELEYYVKRDKINININEYNSVLQVKYLQKEDYHKIFESNIILLDLYLTTINNTFLEALISNTPILLNRKQEYIDLIGKDYPLFFDNISEINSLINDDKNILNATNFLKRIDKKKFNINFFIDSIIQNIKHS